MSLRLDWCSHEAAKYACEKWHYSECLPAGKTVKVGVWEDNAFVGVVIYSHGANNNACKYFGLTQVECCELTRVALNRTHKTPVSKILSISRKLLVKLCPKIKVVFSYADKTNQQHHGGIYQADNWLYLGERTTADKGAYYFILGKKIHGRSARAKYGHERNFPKPWRHAPSETKHLYVKLLDANYQLKHAVKSYPKRAGSKAIVATGFQSVEGGETPTPALQSSLLSGGVTEHG